MNGTFVTSLGVAALLAAFGSSSTSGSQSRSGLPTPDIRVHTDLVVLQVTVFDRSSRFVSGLSQSDFAVFEDRVRQDIDLFITEDLPASIGLVIDNSGSMLPKLADVRAAASAFVLASNPSNELFVVHFNERVWTGLPEGIVFSREPGVLIEALSTIRAVGRTALYDATARALDELNLAANLRRVIVIISDGGDNASRVGLKALLDRAKRGAVVIYTMGLFDDGSEDRNPKVLKQLASATGGESYFPDSTREATSVLERVAQDIRSAYTIGYVPTNANRDGSYRKIDVSLQGLAATKRLRIRARDGYLAVSEIDGNLVR